MTNGDRIRALTDEELAKYFDGFICRKIPNELCKLDTRKCAECKLKWLRKEANDG